MEPEKLVFKLSHRKYQKLHWTTNDKKRIWQTDKEQFLSWEELTNLMKQRLRKLRPMMILGLEGGEKERAEGEMQIQRTKTEVCSFCIRKMEAHQTFGLILFEHSVLSWKTYRNSIRELWIHGYPANAYPPQALINAAGGVKEKMPTICIVADLCSLCEEFYSKMYLSFRRAKGYLKYDADDMRLDDREIFRNLACLSRSSSSKSISKSYTTEYNSFIASKVQEAKEETKRREGKH